MLIPEANGQEEARIGLAVRGQSHPAVRELARGTVRTALRPDARFDRADGEVRRLIRQTCDLARAHDIAVERLLVVVKQAWVELPEARQASHTAGWGTLDRVVTLCIEEYYAVRTDTKSSTNR